MVPDIEVGVDQNDVSTDFPIAPAGTYRCLITSVKPGTSQAQKPKLVFGYTPIDPIVCQQEGKDVPVGGREIFRQSVSLAPNALFTLKGIQKAVGGAGWKGTKVNTDDFLQKSVMLTVSVGEKDGRKFNSVTNVGKVA